MTTAWGEPQLWASEGDVWRAILKQAREAVEGTLRGHGIKYDLSEFRWDTPDFTFSWPKRDSDRNSEGQYRNIHCWVEGRWPVYSLNIEAAAWHDQNLERRVAFVHSVSLRVTGMSKREELSGESIKIEGLEDTVVKVLDAVKDAQPDRGQVYPLEAPHET